MKPKKYIFVGLGLVSILIISGFTVPLGSYTTTSGCPMEELPKIRLHMIKGDSIKEVKDEDALPQNPAAGCAANAEYTLYLF
jgi:hypothetical protein